MPHFHSKPMSHRHFDLHGDDIAAPSVQAAVASPYITGTPADEWIYGTNAPETIEGLGGNDNLFGRGGNDELFGGDGTDKLYCEDGNDTGYGGMSNDVLSGGFGDDVLHGEPGRDQLFGDDGNDTLWGGTGNDILKGLKGADVLIGGEGADHFAFLDYDQGGIAPDARDLIVDFQTGLDKIDLGGIDADAVHSGNNVFRLSQTTQYDGAPGSLRVVVYDGNTYVMADRDGDKVSDFAVQLEGIYQLTAADFIL